MSRLRIVRRGANVNAVGSFSRVAARAPFSRSSCRGGVGSTALPPSAGLGRVSRGAGRPTQAAWRGDSGAARAARAARRARTHLAPDCGAVLRRGFDAAPGAAVEIARARGCGIVGARGGGRVAGSGGADARHAPGLATSRSRGAAADLALAPVRNFPGSGHSVYQPGDAAHIAPVVRGCVTATVLVDGLLDRAPHSLAVDFLRCGLTAGGDPEGCDCQCEAARRAAGVCLQEPPASPGQLSKSAPPRLRVLQPSGFHWPHPSFARTRVERLPHSNQASRRQNRRAVSVNFSPRMGGERILFRDL